MQGKVAIITGSGQGLGKAFAKQLLMRGAKVFLIFADSIVFPTFLREKMYQGHHQVCLSDVRTETGLKTFAELEDTYGRQNVHFIRFLFVT